MGARRRIEGAATSGRAEDRAGGEIGRRRRAAQEAGGEEYVTKRREVLDAAAVVFQRKGYQAATLHDVARELGSDRATLYYYFAGKQELLRGVVDESVDEMVSGVREIARSDATAREKLRNLADHLMEVYESHFPYPYVFIQENLKATWQEKSEWAERLTARVREVQSQVRGIVEHGIRDGEFRSDIPVELVVNGLFGMVNWSHRWFRPGQQHSGADVGRAFATLLLDGLGEGEHRLKPRD